MLDIKQNKKSIPTYKPEILEGMCYTFGGWEDLVKKMADFGNHRKFTLSCLKVKVTSVSFKLKNIRTQEV